MDQKGLEPLSPSLMSGEKKKKISKGSKPIIFE